MPKKNSTRGAASGAQRLIQVVQRAPRLYRKDIADWQAAKREAQRDTDPRQLRTQELYSYILDDAHLSSQLQLRKAATLAAAYDLLRPDGEVDTETTERLRRMPAMRTLTEHILDAQFYGYSLVELGENPLEADPLAVTLIDRRHVVPSLGIVLVDTSDNNGIAYREMREYGTWLLEFDTGTPGLLDKAVPHVLYKRFAQSCWSEFCEVCGMPPRVIKTNTQDPELRQRYLDMLSNQGTGLNGLIDTDDEMIFVATNASNGEAYENLIRLCTNEISLLVNGAVLGQDTKFGSNSKERTSAELNGKVTDSDMAYVEASMNTVVLPALERLGIVPAGTRFRYREQENTTELFEQTMRAAQWFEIDPEWVKNKFGIEVTGSRLAGMGTPAEDSLSLQNSKRNNQNAFEEKLKELIDLAIRNQERNHQDPAFDPFV